MERGNVVRPDGILIFWVPLAKVRDWESEEVYLEGVEVPLVPLVTGGSLESVMLSV
jgi:hypothetical protein